jgi:hypothetical protein
VCIYCIARGVVIFCVVNMTEWMNEWMNEWMTEWMNEWNRHIQNNTSQLQYEIQLMYYTQWRKTYWYNNVL